MKASQKAIDNEEDVGPAIPAGFVPDRGVQIAEEDAGFDEGDVRIFFAICINHCFSLRSLFQA